MGSPRVLVLDPAGKHKITGVRGATGATGAAGASGDLNPETHLATLATPVPGDFSWVNQGSSSVVDDTASGGGVVLIGAATGSGANLVARVKTAPSTPYVITTYLLPAILAKQYQGYGLCFRESSSGKLHVFDVLYTSGSGFPFLLRSTTYTGPTSGATDYTAQRAYEIRWLRIADDGTNRICSFSADGVRFHQFHSIGRTDVLTANQIGFLVSTENLATPNFAPILRVQSWRQT